MNSEAVYEIYIDVLYGNYVVMDYLILTLTGIFLKRSATRLRKILTSMLCAGTYFNKNEKNYIIFINIYEKNVCASTESMMALTTSWRQATYFRFILKTNFLIEQIFLQRLLHKICCRRQTLLNPFLCKHLLFRPMSIKAHP